MKIYFRVFGGLTDRFAELLVKPHLDLNEGTTLAEFLQRYPFPPKAYWMVTVNKSMVEDSYLLKEGDTIEVFPPIGGGQ